MKIAYSYARFSSKEQESGDSLRRQIKRTEEYAAKHGLVLHPLKPDRAMSGFDGTNLIKGSLGIFMAMVIDKKIPKDSWLLVESLDRISRKEPLLAQITFTQIILAGITVVTLADGQIYTREKIKENPALLFISLGIMIRAHEESATKSYRSAEYNKNRVSNAKAGKPQRGKCPSWLKFVDGKFVEIPEMVSVVKEIVKLTLEGVGAVAITRILNEKKRPLMRETKNKKCKAWGISTVRYIQSSKTLIGEYQPKQKIEGKKSYEAKGSAIQNYYPSIITEKEFYRMQQILNKRKTGERYRVRENVANIFGSVLRDGFDGSTMRISCAKADSGIIMKSALRRHGASSSTGFGYVAFETAFLKWITEINITPAKPISDLDGLEAKLGAINNAIKNTQLKLNIDMDNEPLLERLAELGRNQKQVKFQIEQEKAKSAATSNPKNTISLIKQLSKATGEELKNLRLKIKAEIGLMISRIEVFNYRKKMRLICVCVVQFVDGTQKMFLVGTERGQKDFWFPISFNKQLKKNMPDFDKIFEQPYPAQHRATMLEFVNEIALDQLNRPKNDLSELEWKGIIDH